MVLRKEDCVSLPTDAYSISFVGVLPTIGNIPPRQLANWHHSRVGITMSWLVKTPNIGNPHFDKFNDQELLTEHLQENLKFVKAY